MSQATQINPQYAWAHYWLAVVYKGQGNTRRAIEHFQAVVRIARDTSLGKLAAEERVKLGAEL